MEINKIYQGDALSILKTFPDEFVDCVITSPPYWSLRNYGENTNLIWNEDKNCKHDFDNIKRFHPNRGKRDGLGIYVDPKYIAKGASKKEIDSKFCLKCNAWKGQLGSEPTIELYIKHLCDIFDEVKRVLKKDGTCFVNMGDTYAGSGNGTNDYRTEKSKSINGRGKYSNKEYQGTGNAKALHHELHRYEKRGKTNEVIAKSLCMIPSRFAIEMCNRGWILRNEIIWWKSNCMPASVKDRFTVDFEKIFFFVKSKKYYFEQQFEPHLTQENRLDGIVWNKEYRYDLKENKIRGLKKGNVQVDNEQRHSGNINYGVFGRNMRCVWKIPLQPLKEKHFAAYPEKLIETPIRAGCPEFVCNKCGKSKNKIFERIDGSPTTIDKRKKGKIDVGVHKRNGYTTEQYNGIITLYSIKKFVGYTNCNCNAGFSGGIILDPFMGSGTTAIVALKQGKQFVGIELNENYCDIARKRLTPYLEQKKVNIFG